MEIQSRSTPPASQKPVANVSLPAAAPSPPAVPPAGDLFQGSGRLPMMTTLEALRRSVNGRGGHAVTETVSQARPETHDPHFHHATGSTFQGVLQAARSKALDPATDRAEGRQALAEVMRADRATPTRDAAIRARVQSVWDRLKAALGATSVPFELTVGDDARPRAFSVGGGQVYISARLVRLLPDDALAYVLAHEMHHDLHRDIPATAEADAALDRMGHALEARFPAGVRSWRALDAIAQRAALDRQMELEADRAGLDLVARAGFDPEKALVIHQPDRLPGLPRLPFDENHRWRTHPDDAERLRQALAAVRRTRPASGDAATSTAPPAGAPPRAD
jgi:predicted Zn-dependent protease